MDSYPRTKARWQSWHRWFAWRPAIVMMGQTQHYKIVWLETVMRRHKWIEKYDESHWTREYRLIR